MKRLVLFLVICSATSQGLPPKPAAALLARARSLLGTPYEFGGRMRVTRDGRREGIDCQGLVFMAAQALTRCSWKSFAVLNVETVKHRELGVPVEGLAPVATAALDVKKLEPGDYLMLVGPVENPKEAAIGALDGTPVWVWHVGLYAGEGKWIVGDHHEGKVAEVELVPYLEAHADEYAGVFVTRMAAGPTPRTCRR